MYKLQKYVYYHIKYDNSDNNIRIQYLKIKNYFVL